MSLQKSYGGSTGHGRTVPRIAEYLDS